MKVIGYVRVSTTEQADSGLSLASQRAKIEALCQLNEWELTEVVEDAGASAKSMDREGLQRVLGLIRSRKVDALVIVKLDRLTRSTRDLFDLLDTLKRYGVRLVSHSENLDTESAMGRFFLTLLGGIAQWERDTISERTETAMDQLRKEGRRFSRIAPLGWQYTETGEMEMNSQEQGILSTVKSLRESGLSLREIGKRLLEMGHTPRHGREWSPSVIRKALQTA